MTHVVVVGAGPAGAGVAGLLAHRGVDVTLVERRRDFAREFRGEILMPSGMEALQQMGLDSILREVPTQTLDCLSFFMNGRRVFEEMIEASVFDGRPPLAVSQPLLLDAMVEHARRSPNFRFERGVSVRELLFDGERISGIRIRSGDGEADLAADLVIGADGRNSMVRRHAGMKAEHNSPPMDVVWCKLPCPEGWAGVHAYAGRGHLLFAYRTWDQSLQLGWVILKGTFGELRDRGIEQWVEEMANHVDAELAAHLQAHAARVTKPFLLDAVSDCVDRWRVPGALVIGDAAHTMSPVGGQGINIALRDAVVAANHLVPVLADSSLAEHALGQALDAIERERMPEITQLQKMQAQPPKVMLNRSWWGEPVRRIAAAALSNERARHRAASRVAAFPFGLTEVRLTV